MAHREFDYAGDDDQYRQAGSCASTNAEAGTVRESHGPMNRNERRVTVTTILLYHY